MPPMRRQRRDLSALRQRHDLPPALPDFHGPAAARRYRTAASPRDPADDAADRADDLADRADARDAADGALDLVHEPADPLDLPFDEADDARDGAPDAAPNRVPYARDGRTKALIAFSVMNRLGPCAR